RRRAGQRLQLLALDVRDEERIAAAAEQVGRHCAHLHLVLNVSGVLHGPELQPEKRLEHVSGAALAHGFAINAFAPLLMARHFFALLKHRERAVIANLSARVGSISDNRLGGWYTYRASKAAQNMMTKTLSIELARRAPNIVCVALHPGTVDTELSRPFQRNVPAERLFAPERAVSQLLAIIDSLTPEQSGQFLAWDGQPIPW
ncbi:MAG: SDR family NAD(P)-dependent oxidoreductase, partial [Myxococcota bacterium]